MMGVYLMEGYHYLILGLKVLGFLDSITSFPLLTSDSLLYSIVYFYWSALVDCATDIVSVDNVAVSVQLSHLAGHEPFHFPNQYGQYYFPKTVHC